jgi:hypothetical protein
MFFQKVGIIENSDPDHSDISKATFCFDTAKVMRRSPLLGTPAAKTETNGEVLARWETYTIHTLLCLVPKLIRTWHQPHRPANQWGILHPLEHKVRLYLNMVEAIK